MDGDGSPTVVLTVDAPAWQGAFGALEPLAERIVRGTLQRATSNARLRDGEVSLLLTDDKKIRSLNAAYRARDRATNVLSFPAIDLVEGEADEGTGIDRLQPVLLGDVVISFERVIAEAEELGKAPIDHVAHLLVHGTLHLLGYDHGDEARAEVMEGLEAVVLRSLGYADPYPLPGSADAVETAAVSVVS